MKEIAIGIAALIAIGIFAAVIITNGMSQNIVCAEYVTKQVTRYKLDGSGVTAPEPVCVKWRTVGIAYIEDK